VRSASECEERGGAGMGGKVELDIILSGEEAQWTGRSSQEGIFAELLRRILREKTENY